MNCSLMFLQRDPGDLAAFCVGVVLVGFSFLEFVFIFYFFLLCLFSPL